MNLFTQAVAQAQDAPSDKKDKTAKAIINASAPEDIDRLFEVRGTVKDLTAEMKMLEGNVKQFGKTAFLEQALKTKTRPGSFYLQGKKHKMLFISQDKYLSDIPPNLPSEITETHVSYEMDAALVEQYGEELSKAIMSANIPDQVKGQIIKAVSKTTIRKGAIERIVDFPVLSDLIVYQLKG